MPRKDLSDLLKDIAFSNVEETVLNERGETACVRVGCLFGPEVSPKAKQALRGNGVVFEITEATARALTAIEGHLPTGLSEVVVEMPPESFRVLVLSDIPGAGVLALGRGKLDGAIPGYAPDAIRLSVVRGAVHVTVTGNIDGLDFQARAAFPGGSLLSTVFRAIDMNAEERNAAEAKYLRNPFPREVTRKKQVHPALR